MTKVKHILFDCDGVLVDTEYTAAIKMTAALQSLGVDVTVDYYLENLTGTTFSSIVDKYLQNSISNDDAVQLVERVEDEVAEDVKLIEGVDELLSSITLKNSVVSNSAILRVEHALRHTGIDHHFSKTIFSAELVNRPKPAPDVYLLAIKSLGCAPSEIIVVEDSITGATAAIAAGLKVIGFTGASHILPAHEQKLRAVGVTEVAPSMQQLGAILNKILLD